MPNQVPTDEVLSMQRSGMPLPQMTGSLQKKGYSLEQINEAVNQATIKSGVEGRNSIPAPPGMGGMQESVLTGQTLDAPMPDNGSMPEAPMPDNAPAPMMGPSRSQPQQYYPQPQQEVVSQMLPQGSSVGYAEIQALVEEVIEEKWKEFTSRLGDIPTWKSEVYNEVESTKQELLRLEKRFEDMQIGIFGKVKEYGTSMKDLGSEMKALEKVFEKIIGPMTENIKELDKITNQLKGKK